MDALDGNAIAGQLYELFGRDMTTATGACAHCGAVAQIAEVDVYARAPGAVARCRNCGEVVMVITNARGQARIDHSAFGLLDAPGALPANDPRP